MEYARSMLDDVSGGRLRWEDIIWTDESNFDVDVHTNIQNHRRYVPFGEGRPGFPSLELPKSQSKAASKIMVFAPWSNCIGSLNLKSNRET